MSLAIQAQEPLRLEYFLDTDPGYGLAQSISDIQEGDNMLTFDLGDVAFGAHLLSVRSQDSEGRWSTTMSRPLFIDRLQDIDRVEYFIDIDPGLGQAEPVTLPDDEYKAQLDLDLQIVTDTLSPGVHVMGVRACDRLGQWTDVLIREFEVVEKVEPEPLGVGTIARMEYFFDTDPGYGNGSPLKRATTGAHTYEVSFDMVEPGAHLFCLRAQDEKGQWSAVLSRPLYVMSPLGVAAIEYFFDTDPGEGKATPVSVPDNLDEAFAFVAATDGLPIGEHRLCVRAKGLDGLWTLVSSSVFTVSEGGLKGDVNGDGVVDVADIATIISVMAGSVESDFPTLADVNVDGTVDVADIATIISIMAANARRLAEMGE
ncbi:MAG: dockerin type I repeat-containing protein [Prevotella sp.]|nr:dockerin type I repeat-containing protein [Prevotella sp.]